MGRYLIKPTQDSDFYVDWSTFFDDAVSWGSREDMKRWGASEERLERCDKHGTSANWFRRSWNVDWKDGKDGEIWKQQGWLPYANMEDFLEKISELYPGDERIPENLLELHPELKEYLDMSEF